MKVYVVLKLDYEGSEIDNIYENKEWAERRREKLLHLLQWNDKMGMFSEYNYPYDYRWVSVLEKEIV